MSSTSFQQIPKKRLCGTIHLVDLRIDVGSVLFLFLEVRVLCRSKRTAKFIKSWVERSLNQPRRVILSRYSDLPSMDVLLSLRPRIIAFSQPVPKSAVHYCQYFYFRGRFFDVLALWWS